MLLKDLDSFRVLQVHAWWQPCGADQFVLTRKCEIKIQNIPVFVLIDEENSKSVKRLITVTNKTSYFYNPDRRWVSVVFMLNNNASWKKKVRFLIFIFELKTTK